LTPSSMLPACDWFSKAPKEASKDSVTPFTFLEPIHSNNQP